MKHLAIGLCLVVFASLSTAPAGATLIGDEVRGQFARFVIFYDQTRTVFPGVEFIHDFNSYRISGDVGASSITVSISNQTPGDLALDTHFALFGSLDWVGVADGIVVGLELVSNDGFDIGSLIWLVTGDHSVRIDLGAQTYSGLETASATFNIITNHDIPEPTTMALLATGAAGLIAKRRRVV